MSEQLEYRTVAAAPQVRAVGDGKRFIGTPIAYGQRTLIGRLPWGFYEEIAPGAASRSIEENDIAFLVDHDSSMVVSRTSAGTLTITEDDQAVYFDSELNARKSYVADLIENLSDGSISGMSFGFFVRKDSWRTETMQGPDGKDYTVDVRTVEDLDLIEGSAVTFPAYGQAEAALRDAVSAVREHRELLPMGEDPIGDEPMDDVVEDPMDDDGDESTKALKVSVEVEIPMRNDDHAAHRRAVATRYGLH